jgi:tRNA pseudouridine13 synthase
MLAAGRVLPDWERALGAPHAQAVIRARTEDFEVRELPLVEPSGSGNHLWLQVEKRNANTNWVAGQLAAAAGVPPREVGFAGLKDRRSLAVQWFSVGLQEASSTDWRAWKIEDVTILNAVPHHRKLRRGALRGNRFRIRLRAFSGDRGEFERRLQVVIRDGVPNYFGPQRFGHGGRNVERGLLWLERGGRVSRQQRSLYLSALRSVLFNRVLSLRVQQGSWNRLLDGDVAILDGSRSLFCCSLPDADLERRCAAFDIHPTGPLAGRNKGLLPGGAAADLEQAVLEADEPLLAGLQRAGAEAARRSLRLTVRSLGWEWEGPDPVLEFALPAGGYATAVLRELVSLEPASISDDV